MAKGGPMKTMRDLADRAYQAATTREQIAFDVADNRGLILDNVAHMRDFRIMVAFALIDEHPNIWSHLEVEFVHHYGKF
jgi:hypothetical protein